MTLKDVNVRDLQTMLGKSVKRSLSNLIKDAKKIHLTKQTSPFEIIRNQLVGFVTLKLADFSSLHLL